MSARPGLAIALLAIGCQAKPPAEDSPGAKPHDGIQLAESRLLLAALPTYDSVDAFCKQANARKPQVECGAEVFEPALPKSWPNGWRSAHWFAARPVDQAEASCNLAIDIGGKIAVLEELDSDCGSHPDLDNTGPRFEAVTQGDWFVLLTSTMKELYSKQRTLSGIWKGHASEQLRVCADDRTGTPACTRLITLGELTHVIETRFEAGADGRAPSDEIHWRLGYKLAAEVLTIQALSGKPNDEAAAQLGDHRLVR